jgi:nucleoside-diphosphate-sugar epimerase
VIVMVCVLVTGARGFIGRRLVRTLIAREFEVVCLDRTPPRHDTLEGLPVRRVTGDIRRLETLRGVCQGVDCVFHLAAATSPRSLASARAINVDGTRNLAQLALQQNTPPVLIFVSSLAVAGPYPEPVTETSPCHPVSAYGRTKLEAEAALNDYARQAAITIVRPPCVFGPADRNLLSLFRAVRRGWNLCAASDYRYSFLHVDDLVAGLMAARERGLRLRGATDAQRQGVYYLADPQAVSFPELANLIAAMLGRTRVRHVCIPRVVGWTAAVWGETARRLAGRRVYFNIDKAREAYGGSWMCDATRARLQLDFAPAASLAQRLEETKTDFQTAGWL